MRPRILWASEYRGNGGGYTAIVEGMALSLANSDRVELKVLGINYSGFQHPLPVSVIPMFSPEHVSLQIVEIMEQWAADFLVVALDLPHHLDLMDSIATRPGLQYVGIFPIEGAPLYAPWVDLIGMMDRAFTISEFGVKTCAEAGLMVDLLPVTCTPGILSAPPEERQKMRAKVQLDGRKVIVKIADNHTRKNWAHTLEFFVKWHRPEHVLYAVTRPENQYGWDLPDLMNRLGGVRVPHSSVWEWDDGAQVRLLKDLNRTELAWALGVSDVMLVDSGNEGACIPIYESFATGVPVVGMDHTAIHEALSDGRGILFPPGYEYTDPFGGVRRWYPEYESWCQALDCALSMSQLETQLMVQRARDWIIGRTWPMAAQSFLDVILG